jgi:hypothetical protein
MGPASKTRPEPEEHDMAAATLSPDAAKKIANALANHKGDNTRAPGQVTKAVELISEIRDINPEWVEARRALLNGRWVAGTATFEFVSSCITEMIAFKRANVQLNAVRDLPQVPDGRYAVTGTDGVTKFYRVTNKGGHYRLFVYASDTQHPLNNWSTAVSVLRQIDADGIEKAAVRFGVELGSCYRCGRTLTDPTSRALGIGPDCRQK